MQREIGYRYNAEEVFEDYKGRQAAIIQALTTDCEEFRKQCDPEKGQLCLYGRPNGRWDVKPPQQQVPPEFPEPVLIIDDDVARDDMQSNDWISNVAVHSDAWLVSIAFFNASARGFSKASRERLFNMINNLPTVCEAVKSAANKQQSDNNDMSNSISSKESVAGPQEKKCQCGICEEEKKENAFGICCGPCDTWFHGECLTITPPMEKLIIKYYKCSTCCKAKKARP